MDIKKNFWKQLGAWGTRFKDRIAIDILASTRFRIGTLYALFGFTVLLVAAYYTNSGFRLLLVLLLLLASYFLAGLTLQPIKRNFKERERFIANVSHELRTPLSVMKSQVEAALMDERSLTKDELVDLLKDNLAEIDRMSKTIYFLLHFSDVQERAYRLSFGRVNLVDTVKKCMALIEPELRKKDLNMTLAVEGEGLVIRANKTAIEEMVMQLFRNAVNFSRPGEAIRVAIYKTEQGRAAFRIQDHGLGIHKADIPHIFEPFYKGANTFDSQRRHAAGLGLAIVRELARAHKAAVRVDSHEGAGTVVSAVFPLPRQ